VIEVDAVRYNAECDERVPLRCEVLAVRAATGVADEPVASTHTRSVPQDPPLTGSLARGPAPDHLICVLSLNTLHCAGYGPTPEPDRCIIAARQGGRYALLVSQPEIQRQVRQQRGDIDALYELVERVDQKIDALDVKVDRRFDEISGQLSEVLRQLRDR